MTTPALAAISYHSGDATAPLPVPGHDQAMIVHVCNDLGAWGAGFVLSLADRWPQTREAYRDWHTGPHQAAAGQFQLGHVQFVDVAPGVTVANMIAQRGIRPDPAGTPPIRYPALAGCLVKVVAHIAAHGGGFAVHMPRIGCGLAGGSWHRVSQIIEGELVAAGLPVLVYDLPGSFGFNP